MYKNCNSLGSFPKNYVTSFSKVNKIKNVYSKRNVVDLYKKNYEINFHFKCEIVEISNFLSLISHTDLVKS